MVSYLIVHICYPLKQRRVSVLQRHQLVWTTIYMCCRMKVFPFPQDPFSAAVKAMCHAGIQRRLYIVIQQANKARCSCWRKCSIGQIVSSSFTANFDSNIYIVEVHALTTSTRTLLKDTVRKEIFDFKEQQELLCLFQLMFFFFPPSHRKKKVLQCWNNVCCIQLSGVICLA